MTNREPIRCVFLPYGVSNPYPDELERRLAETGVSVERPRVRTLFLWSMLARWRPQVLHLHWLYMSIRARSSFVAALKLLVFAGQVGVLRLSGVRVVWTVHNIEDHEAPFPRVDTMCRKLIARLSHGVVVYCDRSREEVIARFGVRDAEKITVIPHGNVIDYYENAVSRSDARKSLDLAEDDLVFLAFGEVRPYKGVVDLVAAFRELGVPRAKLLIVGRVSDDSFIQVLNDAIGESDAIAFLPGFVDNDRIQIFMNASDIVVCPFRRIHTSGSIVLAMSFAKPCIAPMIGCIPEVLDREGSFLYDPENAGGLANALALAVEHRGSLEQMGRHNREVIARCRWEDIATEHKKLYERCLGWA
jgi:beta-1,4-mannosyltransferase